MGAASRFTLPAALRYPLRTMKIPYRIVIAGLLALVMAGCASWQEQDETKDWSVEKLYHEAHQELLVGNYTHAIEYFEKLQSRYPFGPYSEQAQIEVAYAYYKEEEPESAIAAIDRFKKLHPRHRHLDYMLYLRGLINFNRRSRFVEAMLPSARMERDPSIRREAYFDFDELVRRFPASRYAEDARQRMIFLRNILARYELQVADYYMRRSAWVAVINRAKYVIQHYDRTPAVVEALEMMARAYDELGLEELAANARRVKEYNYPDMARQPARGAARREPPPPPGGLDTIL